MKNDERTLDDWMSYGIVLCRQTRELLRKIGHEEHTFNEPPEKRLDSVFKCVSKAHTELAEVRRAVDPVTWERTRVEARRTAEEIFDRLSDVIDYLSQERRKRRQH